MADTLSPEKRSQNMAAIKNRDTKPEIFIRKKLFERGYRYQLGPTKIPGHPDIYLAKYNAAIFIHGCFWHRHKGCKLTYTPKSRIEFWNKKFDDNTTRDRKVAEMLHNQNIRFLIVWECAVRAAMKKTGDVEILIDRIEAFIIGNTESAEISVM